VSEVISASVPDDLADRIDEARDGDESMSACIRRLIRTGLEADAQGGERRYIVGIPVVTIQSLALAVAVGAFGSFSRNLGFLGLGVLVAVTVYLRVQG
jgi:hypothetical protein